MVGLRAKDGPAQDSALQKSRKPFDEDDRPIYLPPGLLNHGNTCFMNSVLQGLIATRTLADIMQFMPLSNIPASVRTPPTASHRSPLLTNEHGLGGAYDQPWVPGMPIGDVFVTLMMKAWTVQQGRRRENMSPRGLLNGIGRKYDQYLDFAQQDAHEFLRQLLDAMRMEELDIIKKRRPPPSSQDKSRRRRRRSTMKPQSPPTPASLALPQESQVSDTSPPPPTESEADDELVSFVDILFGGKLTSILVCEKCKHISQTHEDFNDLSLSIRPDDYGKHRKTGRFRAFAKRVAALPSTALSVNLTEKQRSLSVPPSPREAAKFIGVSGEPPIIDQSRRRSLDISATRVSSVTGKEASASTREPSPEREHQQSSSIDALASEETKHLSFIENVKAAEKRGKKEKDDEGWAKFGRRISMSIRLGKDKEHNGRPRPRSGVFDAAQIHLPHSPPKDIEGATSPPTFPSTSPSSVSDVTPDPVPPMPSPPAEPIRLSLDTPKRPSDSGPKLVSPPLLSQPSLSNSRLPTMQHFAIRRPRTPQPPKSTPQETAYLRQVLADITPASSNPFTIFRQNTQYGTNGAAAQSAASAYALWLKMGHLPGIEECLRMFTAVEILDGENMVGCRRCWKIANGLYKPHHRNEGECEEEGDSDSGGDNPDDVVEEEHTAPKIKEPSPQYAQLAPTSQPYSMNTASLSSPTVSSFAPSSGSDAFSKSTPHTRETTPFSSSSVTVHPTGLIFQIDNTSAAISPHLHDPLPKPSTPTVTCSTIAPLPPGAQPPVSPHTLDIIEHTELPPLDPRLLAIPSISTTAPPDSPIFNELRDLNHDALQPQRPDTPSADSLRTPRVYHRRPKESDFFDGNCESSEADSDVSTGASVFEHSGSSSPSPSAQQSDLPAEQRPKKEPVSRKTARTKEVIMRAAYKRYLIGTPPPVLVIHLKRFQQVSRSYMMSFSHGLKKLDDYVTFPEYLDLTPFLAPKKEDFGLGRGLSIRNRAKEKDRCMYRLYAVVVHIGNMLGGHYVAYTALPAESPIRSSASSTSDNQPGPNANDRAPRRWAFISDTVVRLTTIEEVLKVKAYICMYERI